MCIHISLQKMYTWPEKVLDIFSQQRNANQNHSEVPRDAHWAGHHKFKKETENKCRGGREETRSLTLCWSERNMA